MLLSPMLPGPLQLPVSPQASIMSGTELTLGIEGHLSQSVEHPGLDKLQAEGSTAECSEGQSEHSLATVPAKDKILELKKIKEEIKEITLPTPVELHKVSP